MLSAKLINIIFNKAISTCQIGEGRELRWTNGRVLGAISDYLIAASITCDGIWCFKCAGIQLSQ